MNFTSSVIIGVVLYLIIYVSGSILFDGSYIHVIGLFVGFIACLIIVLLLIVIREVLRD